MLDELKKLIADAEKEEWDLDEFNEEFEEIAQAYLQAKYTEYSGLQEHEDQAQKELDKISHLKNLVKDYEHDEKFPAFRINQQAAADKQVPTKQLHGIGFIYDHDKDDRVLVAIEKMIAMEMAGLQVIDYDLAFDIKSDLLSKQIISSDYDSNIIAVAEYKGSIAVFIKELPKADGIVRLSCYEREIEVCGDHWPVEVWILFKNEWIAVDDNFKLYCMNIVVNQQYDEKSWRDHPATNKQLNYLKGLGYGGPAKISKGQAKNMIDSYLRIK
jgi:hypothetical protein